MARTVYLTAGSPGISASTLFVIIAVIVIVGYVILEKGTGDSVEPGSDVKVDLTSNDPVAAPPTTRPPRQTKSEAVPAQALHPRGSDEPHSQSERRRRPRAIDTSDPTPRSPSSTSIDTSGTGVPGNGPVTAITDLSPSLSTSSLRSALRGSRGGKASGNKITFFGMDKDGNELASAASRMRGFHPTDQTGRYWDADDLLEHRRNRYQTGHGKPRPAKLSPLDATLREQLRGCGEVLKQMRYVETLTGASQFSDAWESSDAEMNRDEIHLFDGVDQWFETGRWGMLPLSILNTCKEVLLLDDKIISINHLATAMDAERCVSDCPSYPASIILTSGFEPSDTGGLQMKDSPEGAIAALELLHGWFALPYRAYNGDTWAGGQQAEAGADVPESVRLAVGETGADVLRWLNWMGWRFLVSRIFSPQGADLLDGSARILVSPLSAGDNPTTTDFKLDLTLFVPESNLLSNPKLIAEPAPQWTKGRHLFGAVKRCLVLADHWIQTRYPDVKADIDRIKVRRLFLRPGFAIQKIDIHAGSAAASNQPIKHFTDHHDVRLINLDMRDIEIWRMNSAARMFDGLNNQLHFTHIQFVNLRQYNWYTPANAVNGTTPSDQFDPLQVNFVLGVIHSCLDDGIITDPDDLTQNTQRNADLRRLQVGLDLGGIFPFTSREADSSWQVTWPNIFHSPLIIYVPFFTEANKPQILGMPSIEAAQDLVSGNYNSMATWFRKEETFLLFSLAERRQTIVIVLEKESHLPKLRRDLAAAVMNTKVKSLKERPIIAIHRAINDLTETLNHSIRVTDVTKCQTGSIERYYGFLGLAVVSLADVDGAVRRQDALSLRKTPERTTRAPVQLPVEPKLDDIDIESQKSDRYDPEGDSDEDQSAVARRPPTPPQSPPRPTPFVISRDNGSGESSESSDEYDDADEYPQPDPSALFPDMLTQKERILIDKDIRSRIKSLLDRLDNRNTVMKQEGLEENPTAYQDRKERNTAAIQDLKRLRSERGLLTYQELEHWEDSHAAIRYALYWTDSDLPYQAERESNLVDDYKIRHKRDRKKKDTAYLDLWVGAGRTRGDWERLLSNDSTLGKEKSAMLQWLDRFLRGTAAKPEPMNDEVSPLSDSQSSFKPQVVSPL